MTIFKELAPSAVWKYFAQILRIPRPSGQEEQILAYLEEFARRHTLEFQRDRTGNIVIRKPASAGMEQAPGVILQSHVDMVCEKNSGTAFEFTRDPIQAYVEEDWVRARHTTLGADDGIGIAAALAVLTDQTLVHGPLEALFTVDEERGLTGAFGLSEDMLRGKYLINLDSEDEGEIFIGCAGGIDTVALFSFSSEAIEPEAKGYRITLQGLCGGHSGDDIDKGLGNSNKILIRFLLHGSRTLGLRLSLFEGGNLHNAIPREAEAVFTVPADQVPALRTEWQRFTEAIREEFKYTEKHIRFTLQEAMPHRVMDRDTQTRLLLGLQSVANGVLCMSHSMPGMVETSTNLASVKFTENTVTVTTSQRSALESAKRDAMHTVASAFLLAGAQVSHSEGYPGWTPNPNSRLLRVAEEVYRRAFDREARVRAIHAGLECGLFLKKYPHLEMISIGPTLRGVHSPDERLQVSTVPMFWQLLIGILAELKN
ncbi:MAG: aminoacyl-histidine dipeptidase [Rikenellaceae bacterium]|nr:aminoacyl-histidine dipeptidase [Rikenellaceae bacterium]